ncbi:conserved hypothetical protein [uncultured Defluviicoccus sp.]|uniref:DUF4387 domain-containing protein n=1 Tax=metagenome TaxID=256318 RepID=A0A380T9S6_9ZZZZ|nr:conserved hypothetical protein [uncultured Defluviicoccus sp.]
MAKVHDICRHVRSKNAGPFWVTVDFFFKDPAMFDRYAGSAALGPELFARLFGTDPKLVKSIPVKSLSMMKVSYVRPKPQGWMGERDMHQGQSFARLLEEEVG